jgi:dUTP pyrophosphatase
MQRIAKFEKVSFDQFRKDWAKYDPAAGEADVRKIYDALKLPQRATKGSAGYDFYAPVTITMEAGKERLIPTGIRVKISDGFVLVLVPRSSLGFKYRMQLDNTVGIIDADYYEADNEGHMMCKLINDSREGKTLVIEEGKGMVQGIFLPFGITEDDAADTQRTGGFGSTTR